uniref:Zinc finger protein 385A n=1 Tax=Neogobius melanostomus TaxID=47308 RepID=A0A8C6UQK2_9GOBI
IKSGINRPGPVPAFLRSPAVLTPSLDMKPFLQFPLESPHPASIGLFHNFNTMDPVQKAVMTHTFGPPLLKTKRPIISCNVCQIRFNSESQAEAHYKGNRHARRVKGIETTKNGRAQDGDRQNPDACPCPPSPEPKQGESVSLNPSPSSERGQGQKLLYCSLCKVAVNSLSQLEAHNKGTKHKTILEARSGLGPIKAYPRLSPRTGPEQDQSSDPNSQERTFHCEICNVRVNSELQLKQVFTHQFFLNIFSSIIINLLFYLSFFFLNVLYFKDTLYPRVEHFLSSNQLAMRPPAAPHHHHHLLQGAPLSLLRPAPGPIRTTHGPILFTPY